VAPPRGAAPYTRSMILGQTLTRRRADLGRLWSTWHPPLRPRLSAKKTILIVATAASIVYLCRKNGDNALRLGSGLMATEVLRLVKKAPA
jgi:hypothetical protein